MAANIQLYLDANCTQELPNSGGEYIMDFGILNGDTGETKEARYWAKNTGDTIADDTTIGEQLSTTDPAKMTYWALDNNGLPGEYQAEQVLLGAISPGGVVSFWVKVIVPALTTYIGNPRTVAVELKYWTF